jgi:hypothetical protein
MPCDRSASRRPTPFNAFTVDGDAFRLYATGLADEIVFVRVP